MESMNKNKTKHQLPNPSRRTSHHHSNTLQSTAANSSSSPHASAPNPAPISHNSIRETSYTALTHQVIHQHNYQAHALSSNGSMQLIQRFQADHNFSFQRYSTYEPLTQPVQYNTSTDPSTASHQNASYPRQDSLSHDSTATLGKLQTSSINAEPEYEQYSYTQDSSQDLVYSNTRGVGYYATAWGNHLAGVGTQFDKSAGCAEGDSFFVGGEDVVQE